MLDRIQINCVIWLKCLLGKLKHPKMHGTIWTLNTRQSMQIQLMCWCSCAPSSRHIEFIIKEGYIKLLDSLLQELGAITSTNTEMMNAPVKLWIWVCPKEAAQAQARLFSIPHLSGLTITEIFHEYITLNKQPHNSPDLNPLDYIICSIVEKETNQLLYNAR